jgi:CheY-specific phosphatase CheX
MNSHYFAQYLLNEGTVSAGEMEKLLGKAMDREPGLAVRALRQEDVRAEQLKGLDGFTEQAFEAAVRERKILTDIQIKNLQEAVTGESLSFAQVLLDQGRLDFAELEKQFTGYDSAAGQPVFVAVGQQVPADLEQEKADYSEYTKTCLAALMRFIKTPAVIMPQPFKLEPRHQYYAFSQRILGEMEIVGAIRANEQICMEIAHRYSHEAVKKVDSYTIDCIEEFLNVMTGLFAVKLAKRDMEIDLETPRWSDHAMMQGSHQLSLMVMTGIGPLELLMATDEIF